MDVFRTKIQKISGKDYHEVMGNALRVYRQIRNKTKRRPYIRSEYFTKDKIFLDYFWSHLTQKKWKDRKRRLKFYTCSLDLIKNNHVAPTSSRLNPNNKSETVHRFLGMTKEKEIFCVQIKENKNSGEKCFISVYPVK